MIFAQGLHVLHKVNSFQNRSLGLEGSFIICRRLTKQLLNQFHKDYALQERTVMATHCLDSSADSGYLILHHPANTNNMEMCVSISVRVDWLSLCTYERRLRGEDIYIYIYGQWRRSKTIIANTTVIVHRMYFLGENRCLDLRYAIYI